MWYNPFYLRRLTRMLIRQDRWTIKLIHEGEDGPTVEECTGTIRAAGLRSAVAQRFSSRIDSEMPLSRYGYVLTMAVGDPIPRAGDNIEATQDSTGITKRYHVIYGTEYGDRTEALLDEVQ